MLSVAMLSVAMLSVAMLSVVMLRVTILNVAMLSVVAPQKQPNLKLKLGQNTSCHRLGLTHNILRKHSSLFRCSVSDEEKSFEILRQDGWMDRTCVQNVGGLCVERPVRKTVVTIWRNAKLFKEKKSGITVSNKLGCLSLESFSPGLYHKTIGICNVQLP